MGFTHCANGLLNTEDGPWSEDNVSYAWSNRLGAVLRVLRPNENLSHARNHCGDSVVIVSDERKRNPIGTAGPPQVAISKTLPGGNALDCSVSIDRFRWLRRWRG